MDKPKLRAVLIKVRNAGNPHDNIVQPEFDERENEIIAQAEAEILALFKPMTEGELEDWLIEKDGDLFVSIADCKDIAHALYPHLQFTEAQLDEVLPKKLDSGLVDIGVGSISNPYEDGYNQALTDCKQALIKLEVEYEKNKNVKK